MSRRLLPSSLQVPCLWQMCYDGCKCIAWHLMDSKVLIFWEDVILGAAHLSQYIPGWCRSPQPMWTLHVWHPPTTCTRRRRLKRLSAGCDHDLVLCVTQFWTNVAGQPVQHAICLVNLLCLPCPAVLLPHGKQYCGIHAHELGAGKSRGPFDV